MDQSEQLVSTLQVQANQLREERDQSILQKEEAERRAAQFQAQAESAGTQSQQSNNIALAKINDLAAQLEAAQIKVGLVYFLTNSISSVTRNA